MSWRSVSTIGAPVASRASSLCFSTPPKAISAWRRASCGERPRAASLRVSISMWKRTSSSSCPSTSRLRKIARSAVRIRDAMAVLLRPALSRREHAGDRLRETLPAFLFLGELPQAFLRQLVEARLPVVLRGSPGRADPALPLQPVERGIERPLVDLEHVFGELLDALRDPPAVHRGRPEGLQDQHVEGSLEQVGSGHSQLL